MSLLDIFKDNNKYNEKTIVGALSMIVMIVFALVDIITGIVGNHLVINETIYNSFVLVTIGSFGIAGLEKFASKK
jgi:hypothetical protein|tara:strand:+ start:249 stop:473 length:225 start_codon:yes stop_codon:yes gene_type:complete